MKKPIDINIPTEVEVKIEKIVDDRLIEKLVIQGKVNGNEIIEVWRRDKYYVRRNDIATARAQGKEDDWLADKLVNKFKEQINGG